MASNAISAACSVARRYAAPVCNVADVVSTSTAATQTSDDDVNGARLINTDYRFSANVDSSVNSANSFCPRSVEPCHRLTTEFPQQSATSDHLTSLYPSRMTANDICPKNQDEFHYDKKVTNARVSRVDRSESPTDNMNLRNRPLKAATADINPSITLTSDHISSSADKSVRRPGNRRRSHPSPRNRQPFASHQISRSSSPQRPSISNFFPLKTIGSVCELFRSQICLNSLSHFSVEHDAHSTELYHSQRNHIEPNLAILSIVVGIIESSLTNGTYLQDDDSMFLNMQTEDVMNKNSLYPSGQTLTNGNRNGSGGYSPAEATTAPIVGSSNANLSPLDLPIPTVHYETVETLLNKFATQIKDSVDLSKYPKKSSRELIKKISDVVWSNLHRSYYKDRAHLQTLYSYLTSNRLDCYGVAYTVVAACQLLGFDDVRLVMSEDHAWVVFADGETCEVTWHGKGNDDKIGEPLPSNTDSWLYLNGNSMVCDRFVTVATLVSAMNPSINTTQDSEELAILQQQLLWILYDYGHLSRYPMALGNLGDLEDICTPNIPRKEPIQLFREAIDSAKIYYKDSHVYPYTYLGGYFFRIGRFKDALKCWADAAQVMKKYNYSRDDEEIYKEFQEIANDLIPNIVKYVSSKTVEPSNLPYRIPLLQDAECFAYLLRFYDGLCAWEEGSSTPVLHIGWTKPLVATISKFPHSIRSQVAIKVDYSEENELDSDIEDDISEEGTGRHHFIASTIGERRRRRAASISSSTHDETNGENGHSRQSNGHVGGVMKKVPKLEKESEVKEFNLDNVMSPGADDNRMHSYHSDQESSLWKRTSPGEKNKSSIELIHENRVNDVELDSEDEGKTASAILISKKFAGLKNLLTADKLNTSAIQLQLTAQSQVNVKRNRSGASKSGLCPELDFVSTTTTTLTRTNITNNKRIRRD